MDDIEPARSSRIGIILDRFRWFSADLYKSTLLFGLPSATMRRTDDQHITDFVRRLPDRWHRCTPMLIVSLLSLAPMQYFVRATYADPVLNLIVGLGLITTLVATLLVLAFAVIFERARRHDEFDGGQATRTFIATAIKRARDGSYFTEISLLVTIPSAAARWSLLFAFLAVFQWSFSVPPAAGCSSFSIESTGFWNSNAILGTYTAFLLVYTVLVTYYFTSAWYAHEPSAPCDPLATGAVAGDSGPEDQIAVLGKSEVPVATWGDAKVQLAIWVMPASTRHERASDCNA